MWNSNLWLLSSPSINPGGLPCALLGSLHPKTQPSLVPVSGPSLLKYARVVLELVPECCLFALQTTESVRIPRDSVVYTTGELASTHAALPETAGPVSLMCFCFWIKQQQGSCSSHLKTWAHGGMQGLYTGCGLQGSSGRWTSGHWAFGCSRKLPGFSNSRDSWFKTHWLPQNYEPCYCYTILDDVWLTSWYEQMEEMKDLNLFPPFQHGYKLRLAGCPTGWWGCVVTMVTTLGCELSTLKVRTSYSASKASCTFFFQQKRNSLFPWLVQGWNKGWMEDSHGFLLLVSCLATVGTLCNPSVFKLSFRLRCFEISHSLTTMTAGLFVSIKL